MTMCTLHYKYSSQKIAAKQSLSKILYILYQDYFCIKIMVYHGYVMHIHLRILRLTRLHHTYTPIFLFTEIHHTHIYIYIYSYIVGFYGSQYVQVVLSQSEP